MYIKTRDAPYQKMKYAERKVLAMNLLGSKCAVCGTTERLQFDHIKNDRLDKYHSVSQMLRSSWPRVLRELEQCQLLCISCHANKSIRERGWGIPAHGTLTRYMKLKCKCEACRARGKENNQKQYKRRMGYE